MAAQGQESLRVLVVDDEPEIRELLGEYLTTRGLDVLVAADGRSALLQLKSHPIDVVLTDVRMPVMKGVELIAEIDRSTLSPGIVVMTGFPTVETAIIAMKLGASDYLLKPFRLRDVYGAVMRAARWYRMEQEAGRMACLLAFYERATAARTPDALPQLIDSLVSAALAETRAEAAAVWLCQDGAWEVMARGSDALAALQPAAITEPLQAGSVLAVPLPAGGVLAVAGGERAPSHTACLEKLAVVTSDALMRM